MGTPGTHFVYPFFLCCTVVLLPLLAIVSSAAMNMDVQMSLQDPAFNYFKYTFRPGITESYGSSIFNFLRNLYTVFHRNLHHFTITTSAQASQFLHILINIRDLIFCSCFSFFFFFIMAILVCVRCYLTVVLICTLISDVTHLCICLLAICISLEKCSSPLPIFLLSLFFCDISIYLVEEVFHSWVRKFLQLTVSLTQWFL